MIFYKYWFRIEFEALKEITNLPLYTGIHWSGFFRNELKKYSGLSATQMEFNVSVSVNPETYINKDKIISMNVSTNETGRDILIRWLDDADTIVAPKSNSHFIINQTVKLKKWESSEFAPDLDYSFGAEDVSELTLIFSAPLRLKRAIKIDGRFFDPFHFDFEEFIIRLAASLELEVPDIQYLKVEESSFIWIDVAYKKTLGGIIGGLKITGKFKNDILRLLHFGQFCGLGKNRTFGFGFYTLEEFPHLFYNNEAENNLFNFSALRTKLLEMNRTNVSGSDITAHDLLEHPKFIRRVSSQISKMSYAPQKPTYFKIRKRNGGYRKTAAYMMVDKLLLSILTDTFDRKLQALISSNCFSYRKGYSYHFAARALKREFDNGFSWGIKIDIKSFFDSISFHKILLILKALKFQQTEIYLLQSYFYKFLIQGNTLSPLLSNIAMLSFDKWFRNHKHIKLVRYADDMVIVGKKADKETILNRIKEMLNSLGLEINMNKYLEFSQTSTIDFLGYKISESSIYIPKKKEEDNLEWLSYPKIAKVNTKPLYLSFTITYASTKGNNIYIQSKDSVLKVAWKEISRILILGKPRISGGIIYRAMREEIPIFFMTVHGRPIGGFQNHNNFKKPENLFFTDEDYSYENFCLDFVREVAFTKITNQYRFLKKKDISEPKLTEIGQSLSKCDSFDSIRGKEGFAAKVYFSHFRKLVTPLPFESRQYHPPKGEVNVLLSLGYTLLYRRFAESLRSNGIDSFAGIFHQGRGTHEALASDLMECYRFIVDRIVVALIHKKIIKQENFYTIENSSYLKLDSQGFRSFIRYFEKTMKTDLRIKDKVYTYEVWIDKTVLSFKNSLYLGTSFKSYRSL